LKSPSNKQPPPTNEEDQPVNDELNDRDMALLEKASIIQVVYDEIDNKYYPVINGYETGQLSSNYTVRFKLEGVYLFKLVNHPRNPPIIKIKVLEEQPFSINVTDEGFFPRIIRIGEYYKRVCNLVRKNKRVYFLISFRRGSKR